MRIKCLFWFFCAAFLVMLYAVAEELVMGVFPTHDMLTRYLPSLVVLVAFFIEDRLHRRGVVVGNKWYCLVVGLYLLVSFILPRFVFD